jgi:hypothetical protein
MDSQRRCCDCHLCPELDYLHRWGIDRRAENLVVNMDTLARCNKTQLASHRGNLVTVDSRPGKLAINPLNGFD